MELRNQILKEHTKENCECIIEWVNDSQARFNELFHLFINGEYRVAQRAAWPLSFCVIKYPFLIKNKFAELIANLKKTGIHDAVKRHTMRLLPSIEIPEKQEGAVMDICFSYIEDPREAVAVKAFSLTVLEKMARKYPEIIPELTLIIEDQMPHQTAAFKVRAKKILQIFK